MLNAELLIKHKKIEFTEIGGMIKIKIYIH